MALTDPVAQQVLGEVYVLTTRIDEQMQLVQKCRAEFEAAAERVKNASEKTEHRAGATYDMLLNASAELKEALEALRGGITETIAASTEQLRETRDDTSLVLDTMSALREAVSGDRGLHAQLANMEGALNVKLWTLDKCISDIQAIQHGGPARNAATIISVLALALIFVSLLAGVAIGATDQGQGALSAGSVGVMGLLVGWLGSWLFNDRAARKTAQ